MDLGILSTGDTTHCVLHYWASTDFPAFMTKTTLADSAAPKESSHPPMTGGGKRRSLYFPNPPKDVCYWDSTCRVPNDNAMTFLQAVTISCFRGQNTPHLSQQHQNQQIHQILLQGFLLSSTHSLHFYVVVRKCFFRQEVVGSWSSAVRLIPELYSHCDKVSLRLLPKFLSREVLPFPIPQVAHLVLLKPHSSREQLCTP